MMSNTPEKITKMHMVRNLSQINEKIQYPMSKTTTILQTILLCYKILNKMIYVILKMPILHLVLAVMSSVEMSCAFAILRTISRNGSEHR